MPHKPLGDNKCSISVSQSVVGRVTVLLRLTEQRAEQGSECRGSACLLPVLKAEEFFFSAAGGSREG